MDRNEREGWSKMDFQEIGKFVDQDKILKILNAIKEKGSTSRTIARKAELGKMEVERILKYLQEIGYVELKTHNGTQKWLLTLRATNCLEGKEIPSISKELRINITLDHEIIAELVELLAQVNQAQTSNLKDIAKAIRENKPGLRDILINTLSSISVNTAPRLISLIINSIQTKNWGL